MRQPGQRLARRSIARLAALAALLRPGPGEASVLVSDQIVVGVNSDGSLITDEAAVGLLFDPDGPLGHGPLGEDMLVQGWPWEVWSLAYGSRSGARALVFGGPHIPGGPSFAWSEVGENRWGSWLEGRAELSELSVVLSYELPASRNVLWITVEVTALEPVTDLWVSRSADPDQDAAWGTYETVNHASGGVAVAESRYSGRALALAVDSGLASVCRDWCTRPDEVLSGVAGPVTGDRVIGAAAELGDLALAGSARAVFVYGFGPDGETARWLAEQAAADLDHDGDGLSAEQGDCDDRDPRVSPELEEWADGLDNDCDGEVDEDTALGDDDGDGFAEVDGDCDDRDPRVHPGAPPVPGVADANCDGLVDEGSWSRDGGPPEGFGDEPPAEGGAEADRAGAGCGGCAAAGGGPGSSAGAGLLLLAAAALFRPGRRRRRAAHALALVAVLATVAGCSGPHPARPDGGPPDDASGPDAGPWVWLELSVGLPAGAVIDPKLDGEPSLRIALTAGEELPAGCVTSVSALSPAGRSATLATDLPMAARGLELAFDGRDGSGLPFDPGPVQIAADLYCGERVRGFGAARLQVLRLGVAAVDVEGDEVPLAYHKLDLWQRGLTLLGGPVPELLSDRESPFELADLDLDDGRPRPPPPPWEDPASPPWGRGTPGSLGLGRHNVPVGALAGRELDLEVTFGREAVSEATGLALPARGPDGWSDEAPAVRLSVEGFESVGEASWGPGRTVRLRSAAAMPAELGRLELSLRYRYEALHEGRWLEVPGFHETRHRVYVLPGPSTVPDGTAAGASPSVAWVGVLEDVAPAVEGLPADDLPAIMTGLRTMLHDDPWVVYDPGDAAYTDYEGEYLAWTSIWIRMSDWLDRSSGLDMYCHSMACLLSSLANHLGLEARYVTIGRDFSTNLTRAAGREDWRAWRFNSHGVATLGETGLVWDAAVDLDGDDDPASEPVAPVAPVALPMEDYFGLLSGAPLEVLLTGTCLVY